MQQGEQQGLRAKIRLIITIARDSNAIIFLYPKIMKALSAIVKMFEMTPPIPWANTATVCCSPSAPVTATPNIFKPIIRTANTMPMIDKIIKIIAGVLTFALVASLLGVPN